MKKGELMWACGLLETRVKDRIAETCLADSSDLCLSRRFIDFPLHVSFKRSFYTASFAEVKEDLRQLIAGQGKIDCGAFDLSRVGDMVWLRFEKEEGLKSLHERIDLFLKEKYQIGIDCFDRDYVPHATLFRDEDGTKLDKVYERLLKDLKREEVRIDRFFIGSRRVDNEYFDL
ncbi:MAG: 2'-5' RNA ligase family protein [Erysipelotrichaceae bacterium]|nr:2'-5' RNA ligase family protein [Erysipelotrichaceae bacterium]